MEHLTIANYERYQHYNTRRPPWVKLYRDILTDYDLMACDDTTKWLAVSLLLLASEEEDCRIPYDVTWISNRAHIKKRTTRASLRKLVAIGFVETGARDLLAESNQDATPSRARMRSTSISFSESDQKSKEGESGGEGRNGFDRFWDHYPRRVAKKDALKAWTQTAGERPPDDVLIAKVDELAMSRQWLKQKGEFVPYPATWLRAGGWEDEVRK